MTSQLTMSLPTVLLPFKANIENSIKPFINISAQRSDALTLTQSKFSGLPYSPKNVRYPVDSKKQPMFLLAQLNFAELPPLPMFPEQGILQFFISGSEGAYGLCFDDLAKQADFRVLYFPELISDENQLRTDFSFLPDINTAELPFSQSCALTFNLQYAPMSLSDYQFASKILNTDQAYYYDEEIYEAYIELFKAEGHKVGGYPFFTQTDPRELEQYQDKDYVLLFQMDTDDGENGILWGDCGVANFFITADDLLNKDFSNVLYNWDCC